MDEKMRDGLTFIVTDGENRYMFVGKFHKKIHPDEYNGIRNGGTDFKKINERLQVEVLPNVKMAYVNEEGE